jgi:hypothetical protein
MAYIMSSYLLLQSCHRVAAEVTWFIHRVYGAIISKTFQTPLPAWPVRQRRAGKPVSLAAALVH